MNVIVAVSAQNWGIGCENKLLFHIPEDMKYFRATTKGKVVVMGHSTFKSLPGARPLKYRTNIVLSRDMNLSIPGAIVCHSMGGLFEQLKNYDTEDVFVIGGATIYAELLNRCQRAYITKIDGVMPADTFFPNIDAMPNWTLAQASEIKEYEGVSFQFCVYEHAGPP